MEININDWNAVLDVLLTLIGIFFPGLSLYTMALKKNKAEILALLDQVPIDNRAILEMARASGRMQAAKDLEKLIAQQT